MTGFENIEMIVFDIDGTLAETDDYFVIKASVLTRKMLPFVREKSAVKIIRPIVMTGETLLHSFYRILDLVGLDSVISKIQSRFSVGKTYKYDSVDNARVTVERLSRRYKLGIISSGGRKSTDAFLEKFDLKDFFSFIVSAEDCRFIKPHPMPLLLIAEKADVPIDHCLMVGDTVFDSLCAKRAGARSVAVKTGFDTALFLRLHKADLMLDSIGDLPEILLDKSNIEIDNSMDKPKDLV